MRRRALAARGAGLGLLATALGCVSVPVDPEAGFPALAATIQERAGHRIAWSRGEGDPEIARAVEALLAGGLGADEAVEVALLNNRDLQATYAELGVAQAELVQASLLHNPVLGVASGFGGGAADLLFSLAIDVVDLFYVPLRKRTASADLEEARHLAAGQVLDVAWATRRPTTPAGPGAAAAGPWT
jgi:cobalt-zinc-cadmium efflux system outer membrane protein